MADDPDIPFQKNPEALLPELNENVQIYNQTNNA